MLGRTSGDFCSFLFILLLLLFIYLHLSMFFILLVHLISRLLCHVTGTPPWLLRPMKVSTSSELYPDYFRLPFLFHYRERYRFEWAFFTHRGFLPSAPSRHFWHIPDILAHSRHFGTTCFYQGFAGSRQLLS